MQSKLWHILVVLSSIDAIMKFYEGKNTEETFIENRMFTKNIEYLQVTSVAQDLLRRIRFFEKKQDDRREILHYLYFELKKYFEKYFYKEIEKGIPKDVESISLKDEYLGNAKNIFNRLTV